MSRLQGAGPHILALMTKLLKASYGDERLLRGMIRKRLGAKKTLPRPDQAVRLTECLTQSTFRFWV